jgi:hypothetical protein
MTDNCQIVSDSYVVNNGYSNLVPEGFVKYYGEHDGITLHRKRREHIREEISDWILAFLGAPKVQVELDRQQLSIAIDDAMKVYEDRTGRSEYQYCIFQTTPGVNRYKLNEDIGLIAGVDFRSTSGTGSVNGVGGIDLGLSGGMAPWAGSFYYNTIGHGYSNTAGGFPSRNSPIYANVGEWNLLSGYMQLFQRVSGREPSWEISADNSIILTPTPIEVRTVVVHYLQRKRDWHEAHQWIKDYALANAKEMLGRVRSKFDKYASPGGSVSMDGPALLAESREDKKNLKELLTNTNDLEWFIPYYG